MDTQKKFKLLSDIMRASHFEWRRAYQSMHPEGNPTEFVKQYWTEVGIDTAKFYLSKIDPHKDLPQQVAQLYVNSSVAMGEDAEVVKDAPEGVAYARHNACPWRDWHERENLLEEDQIGCDQWLETVINEINIKLKSHIRFSTEESLPTGGKSCLRKFWTE